MTAARRSSSLAGRGAHGHRLRMVGPEHRQPRTIGDPVNLVEYEHGRPVAAAEFLQDFVDCDDLFLRLRIGGIDDVQEQLGPSPRAWP